VKVLTIYGTRPESIKLVPLPLLLSEIIRSESKVCITAQHQQVLDLFRLMPNYDLDLMMPDQSLAELTGRILSGVKALINIQPFTEIQIPSKLYERFVPEKASLNIIPKGGALSLIVNTTKPWALFNESEKEETKDSFITFTRENRLSNATFLKRSKNIRLTITNYFSNSNCENLRRGVK